MPNSEKSDIVKSIGRAVEVLKALSSNYKKISDIAPALNLSHSTVHRLLHSLKEAGLVAQDPVHHEYYLGNLFGQLASNPVMTHQYLIYCAYQKMEYLRQRVGETVSLYIKVGVQRYRLESLMGSHNLTFVDRPTLADRIWIGAAGKALLSQMKKKDFEILLDYIELEPLTVNTIIDKNLFKKEIEKVRELGYATSRGETDIGVAGIAVPIPRYQEPACITITGPEDRLVPHFPDLVPDLKNKTEEISHDLLKLKK